MIFSGKKCRKERKMAKNIDQTERTVLPVLAVRETVAFPAYTVSFELDDELFMAAAEAAVELNSPVLLCAVKEGNAGKPAIQTLSRIGTIARIRQFVRNEDGTAKVVADGIARVKVTDFTRFANYICGTAITKESSGKKNPINTQAYCRAIISEAEILAALMPEGSEQLITQAKTYEDPDALIDFIAINFLPKNKDRQRLLECFDIKKRTELTTAFLKSETDIILCELKVHKKVRGNLNQNQKEFYLREQIRVIREELGEDDDNDEFAEKIYSLKAPDEIKSKLFKELDRMSKMPFGSAEATVCRTYLDTCLEIPWETRTQDRTDVAAASKILDADHDGLRKVKDRILEFLAVKQLNPELKNQILCLVGPPGVGKTSIGASIARATKRKYVRVSLGGIRDEADIRGHRKTYIGAMPGRIVNALIEAKSKNPLILLDEVDKLTRDAHGDPASALLEVLDGEQNHSFRDHFVEIPLDLSECMFIATANTLDTVPKPLLDRMEIIELTSYTRGEKLAIAKNHLLPKQLKRHGLNRRMLTVSDGAILEIIDFYTREAGVRSLERKIAEIARKAARRIVESAELKCVRVTESNVFEFLGARRLMPETVSELNEVGTVNGLAYTEAGGDVLKVEVAVLEGSGKLELTGSLGDVMKESAKIAVSVVRSIASEYGIDPDFHKNKDIHIHFPEGAVPKDGPSAGVTMVTALVSALSGRAVKRDVAMTGEISLRGKVLAIGGLKEKTSAAYAFGIKEVLIPRDNMQSLEDCSTEAIEALRFIPCENIREVLKAALVSEPARKEREKQAESDFNEIFFGESAERNEATVNI